MLTKLRTKIVCLLVCILMLSQTSIPLLQAYVYTYIDDEIEDIQGWTEDVDDIEKNDIDNINTTIKLEVIEDDLSELIDNVVETLEYINDYSGTINTNDYYDLEDAVDDFIKEIEEALETLEDEISSSLEDDYAEIEDTIEEGIEDINDALDNDNASSNIKKTIDELEDLTEESEDLESEINDVNTSNELDEIIVKIDDLLDDANYEVKKIINVLEISDYYQLKYAVQDFTTAINTNMKLLENEIATDLEDDYTDFKKDIDELITDLNDEVKDLFDTNYQKTPSLNIQNIISDLEVIIEEIIDHEYEAKNITKYNDLAELVNDLIDLIEDTQDLIKSINTPILADDLSNLTPYLEDLTKGIDDTWKRVKERGTGFDEEDYDLFSEDLNDELETLDKNIAKLYKNVSTKPNVNFYDVPVSSEFYEHIYFLVNSNVISGYNATTYGPKNLMTRAEFLKIALLSNNIDTSSYRNKNSSFADVPNTHSLLEYINYAYDKGVISGVNNVEFMPQRAITRFEAVKILVNLKKYSLHIVTVSRFSDVNDLEQIWFIETGANKGIIQGYGYENKFGPNDPMTREQGAKITALAMNKN